MRLAESERKVMEVLWAQDELSARETARLLTERHGWQKTTTYTMLTRCEKKGYLKRTDPHFICIPLVTREEVACWETDELLQAVFGGSAEKLVESLLEQKLITPEQLKKLCK